jgi:hypothetical protein
MSGRRPSRIGLLLLAIAFAGSAAASAAAARPDAGRFHCIARITRYRFQPDTVAEQGQTSLRIEVTNCTDSELAVTLTQFGAEPSPCPVIDPVSRSVRLSPVGTDREAESLTAASCAGDEQMTLRVTGPSGQRFAERTAHLTVTPPG